MNIVNYWKALISYFLTWVNETTGTKVYSGENPYISFSINGDCFDFVVDSVEMNNFQHVLDNITRKYWDIFWDYCHQQISICDNNLFMTIKNYEEICERYMENIHIIDRLQFEMGCTTDFSEQLKLNHEIRHYEDENKNYSDNIQSLYDKEYYWERELNIYSFIINSNARLLLTYNNNGKYPKIHVSII